MHATESLLLQVHNLRTYFDLDEGVLKAVDGITFGLPTNHVLGIVGESGCGKSVTAQSILRIVPPPGRIEGEILFRSDGGMIDLAGLNPKSEQMRSIRGNEIAMVFQEPMAAFSPVHTIGDQLTEMWLVHGKTDRKAAREHAIELLNSVGIPAASRRVDNYPFQFSGGMQQRAMIAMAMMNSPAMLVADEPTTALDVTIQAQILRLMKKLQAETGMSIIYITHDIGVIAYIADEVAVMYRGKLVEFASRRQLFKNPLHPYTKALLRSVPKFAGPNARLKPIRGTVGIPIDPPAECPFVARCESAISGRCESEMPPEVVIETGHKVSCHLYPGSGDV